MGAFLPVKTMSALVNRWYHTYLTNGVRFIPCGILFSYSTCHYGASVHWPRTAYQKSLAEFAARRRQRNKIIFSRDMCVRENTAQAASVEFVRLRRTNYARSRLQILLSEKPGGFFDSLYGASVHWLRNPFSLPLR